MKAGRSFRPETTLRAAASSRTAIISTTRRMDPARDAPAITEANIVPAIAVLSSVLRRSVSASNRAIGKTTVLGIPCLTMRPNTERPITCEIGTNVLVGTDPHCILREATSILDGHTRHGAILDKWGGHAAERIVDILLNQAVRDPPRLRVSLPTEKGSNRR